MCSIKVLHILQSSSFSGAENVVCQIYALVKEQVEIMYCSKDGSIRQALDERGIPFFPLKQCSVSEVRNAINEYHPDIIHAHDMRATVIASLSCGKIPIISHIHNNSFSSRELSIKTLLFLISSKKIHHIFWVSKSAYTDYYFQRLIRSKSSILYNIIDIDSLKTKADSDCDYYDYDVVFLGRLTAPKNPQRMIAILKMVRDKYGDFKAAIIGQGELYDEVCAEIKRSGLDDIVNLLGFMKNPYKILEQSKVMIMTSRWEGTPMCALEAQALGTPIVSTPIDGLKDLIINGENGFLSDSDQELADYIASILFNPEKYQYLSSRSYAMSREYNDIKCYKETILNQYYSAYKAKRK